MEPPTSEVSAQALTEDVLRRYYLEDETKLEIGRALGISRFKVARLLDDAKRRGLVRIEILPRAADPELSEALRRALGLRRAIVVSSAVGVDASEIRRNVGRLGALLVTEVASHESIVGFSSSRGMLALAEAIETFHDCTVVQLNGVPPHQATGSGPVELVRMIAAKSTGHSRVFYAPFVLSSATAALDLRRDPMVRHAMSAYARLDVAVVTVGAWLPGASGLWESVSDREHEEVSAKGAVAEICGILFDAEGRPVATSLTDRTLAIGYHELKKVPELIAVVDSEDRIDAIHAVAAGRHITSLVTSAPIAHALIRMSANSDPSADAERRQAAGGSGKVDGERKPS